MTTLIKPSSVVAYCNSLDTKGGRNLPLALLTERRPPTIRLRERGMAVSELTAHVGLSVTTVIPPSRAYVEAGWNAVDVKPGGGKHGQWQHITQHQEPDIRRLISEKMQDS